MVEVRDLSFRYGKRQIFKDVSFDVEPGQCVGILGTNGAGKSTLITCMGGIRTPETGAVSIKGVNVSKMSPRARAKKIAYVAQKSELSQVTVFDCVLLGRTPYVKWSVGKHDIELCQQALERLGLEHLKLRYVDELSGGEMQKVMLARALVQEPELLLLDEPTSNLDPKNQYEMMDLVRELARERGIAVMVVIHDLNLALRYCDRFYFLKDAKGYSYGGAETVTDETIQAVYGISAHVAAAQGKRFVVFN